MKFFNKQDSTPTSSSSGSSGDSSPKTFFGKDKSKKASKKNETPPPQESSKKKKKSKKAAAQQEAARPKKSRRLLKAAVATTMLGTSGFLIWKYALGEPTTARAAFEGLGDFTNVLKDGLAGLDFGKFFNNDPQQGDTNLYTWRSDYIEPGYGGLHLTLLNALDDTWQDEFYDAVSDWDESRAVTLDVERVDVDYDCNRIDGVMVVCNANFGETGWVGINENEIKRGEIVSSVTKMNEYYLRNAEYVHRRYTMCHEVGHGFGLPHTDEDPYNENLGNCLDYTKDPGSNLYPGSVNLSKLKGMYNSRRKLSHIEGDDDTVFETNMLVVDPDMVEDYDEYFEV